jgi:hypothetical protein
MVWQEINRTLYLFFIIYLIYLSIQDYKYKELSIRELSILIIISVLIFATHPNLLIYHALGLFIFLVPGWVAFQLNCFEGADYILFCCFFLIYDIFAVMLILTGLFFVVLICTFFVKRSQKSKERALFPYILASILIYHSSLYFISKLLVEIK